MNSQALRKRLPDAPGVYFFLGSPKRSEGGLGHHKNVLYIGRATSLRTRVRSYFDVAISEKRSPWIAQMLERAKSVEYKKTASVLEAILLEADLIKKWKPLYNTKEKDDKSFNCIAITDEEFPRVLLVRGKNIRSSTSVNQPPPLKAVSPLVKGEIKKEKYLFLFGPFPHNAHLRTALKIIRKIFPFRDTCVPPLRGVPKAGDVKPCFNRQIGLCPGVCTGEISAKEYRKHIARLALFLSGKTGRVQKALEREMKRAARAQEFERAGELKRQLFSLKHIQDIALLKNPPLTPLLYELPSGLEKGGGGGGFWKSNNGTRIESYDLSHFGGKGIVGAMVVVGNGVARPSEYRLFKLRSIKTQNEIAGLQEIIRRRLKHKEWPFPQLVVVDGNAVQKKVAEQVLAESGYKIPVVAVVKDERHRPREILGFHGHSNIPRNVGVSWRDVERSILLANAEAHRFVLRFQRRERYTRD